ncbi:NTP transferase domain-containing protein [Shewanella mesophila]|uniref:NTP transferase domain-containing protein n=1 Tax=Shewanella mesophila TaxID=2864208 RepID=UPI001C658140|nr:NTP transferase domain-containing protein [Shewanella mesophila]QYJ85870.1 NTP transferase domain-containing protein [Shewanella mesophila]
MSLVLSLEVPSLTLVIMAAGLGSRYGGDKQLARLGPCGETMLELSLASAIKAGFSAAVIVTRAELIEPLNHLLKHLPKEFKLSFCVQQKLDLPLECLALVGDASYRTKPWGTAHALWAARDLVDGPMAVINADDYYGDMAFQLLADGFRHDSDRWQMVAYCLAETLSDHGGVNRGICQTNGHYLTSVAEWLDIAWQGEKVVGHNDTGKATLDPVSLVSMTCWGFTQDIFTVLGQALTKFVKVSGQLPSSECYLPAVVQSCLPSADDNHLATTKAGMSKAVYVNATNESWLGVTYPQDTVWVKQKLMELLGD